MTLLELCIIERDAAHILEFDSVMVEVKGSLQPIKSNISK